MENNKGQWSSNFGFLMAAIGSAVGLGNIWGFPYKMGMSGGFTFLLVYIGLAIVVGMVAMSSHYPFGTQIMINGTMYTVEDRGGSGIENNIHRVDIYVPDHQQALRMGRYTTTATIYRLGR